MSMDHHSLGYAAAHEQDSPFKSFFIGGFECSTHVLRNGRRLDMVSATQHDRFCTQDYQRLVNHGILTAREGLRWPLIERKAGRYDFGSALPMVEASRKTGVQLIWDLCHFGFPSDLNCFGPDFVPRFRDYAGAFVEWLAGHGLVGPIICPLNEISFFSWAAGDCGYLYPFVRGRGFELKVQFVRAGIAAMEQIRKTSPTTRFAQIDPVLHIAPRPERPEQRQAAEGHRQAQFQSWDMLGGNMWPQLGGKQSYLDIIGINFYSDNERFHDYGVIYRDNPLYRPLHELLWEVYHRFGRPLFISETGNEDDQRAEWLGYVCAEVATARHMGVPVHGICLYPILNHPGWDDNRHCRNGLWDYPSLKGERDIFQPLSDQLKKGQTLFPSSENPPPYPLREYAPELDALESRELAVKR